LTDEINKAWAGMSTRQYKRFNGLKKAGLKDNRTNLELVLNMLSKATIGEISKEKKPQTFEENKRIAKSGGKVADNARCEAEKRSGKPVITSKNTVNSSQRYTDEESINLIKTNTKRATRHIFFLFKQLLSYNVVCSKWNCKV
jgi:hypothetical protein